jgi:hypothetical protein
MAQTIDSNWTKDEFQGDCEWTLDNGQYTATVTRYCERFASATSRARGTKVEGYGICVDANAVDSTEESRTAYIAAGDNARAALKRAMRLAQSMMI